MKKRLRWAAALLLLSPTIAARAQGGCINSPENPTVILGLVGSAGALLASLRGTPRRK